MVSRSLLPQWSMPPLIQTLSIPRLLLLIPSRSAHHSLSNFFVTCSLATDSLRYDFGFSLFLPHRRFFAEGGISPSWVVFQRPGILDKSYHLCAACLRATIITTTTHNTFVHSILIYSLKLSFQCDWSFRVVRDDQIYSDAESGFNQWPCLSPRLSSMPRSLSATTSTVPASHFPPPALRPEPPTLAFTKSPQRWRPTTPP